jgi:polar amino acid transport system substrate-binding protein
MQRMLSGLLSCLFAGALVNLVQAEQLRVVLEVSPPHQVVQDGQVSGYTTAVVELMLQKAGLQPRYEVYPWARAYRTALTTPDVLIYNMARTPGREALFDWIGPVTVYRFGLLKLAHRQDIKLQSLADLPRYTVGAQRDDFSAEWLRDVARQPATQLALHADVLETWRMLLHGRVDLLVDDPIAIDAMLQLHHLERQDVEFVLFVPELAQTTWIAVKKGSDPILVQRLKKAHRQITDSPQYRRAMQVNPL